jgi:hypothetical protein
MGQVGRTQLGKEAGETPLTGEEHLSPGMDCQGTSVLPVWRTMSV